MSVDEPIQLNFRYTQSDYVRAVRADLVSRPNIPLDCAVIAVLIGVSVALWRTADLHWLAVGSAAVSAAFALLLTSAFTIFPVLAFHRDPKFRHEYSLTFSDDGIHFCTDHIDSHLEWGIYSRAVINARSYALYHGARQFTVVPKRVFSREEQRLAFENLLTRHVANTVRRDG
jgi:hypothetical protein